MNQSNSTPSIILTGFVTSMLALVSNRARFVISTSHLVVVSDGSWRVFQAVSVEAWIPGALTPMVTSRRLLSSYSSSSWSLGSISILICVSPLSEDCGVQSHSSLTSSPGDIPSDLVSSGSPLTWAETNASAKDPDPWLTTETEKLVGSPTCGMGVEISNDPGAMDGSGVRSFTLTPLTAIANGW